MKHSVLSDPKFLGTNGKMETLGKKTWKLPLVIGIIFVLFYVMYEAYKLSFQVASDMTVYYDYALEDGYRYVTNTILATVVFLIVTIVLVILTMIAINNVKIMKLVKIMVISTIAIIVVSFIFTMIRIVMDMKLLMVAIDPIDAWMYRFYSGWTILVEWKVIPDLLLNFGLAMGLFLVGVSTLDYATKVQNYSDIMKKGLRSADETTSVNGKKCTLVCKEWNGIKACKIKE